MRRRLFSYIKNKAHLTCCNICALKNTVKYNAAEKEWSIVAKLIFFLQSIPCVTVTLSGMSDMDQLKANISTYADEKPLNEAEMKLILDIADEIIRKTAVPCTGCHYCVSKCPKEPDIPFLLRQYNEALVAGAGDFIAPMALSSVAADKQPECCIGCRSCEKVCPQTIRISEELKKYCRMSVL